MGSNDIPPADVPAYYQAIANALLQVGGSLWTICYILLAYQSRKDHTYGMPLFSTAFNIAWEIIYGLYVAEAPLERIVFTIWLVVDIWIVYGIVRHGREEWNHAPLVKKHLSTIFFAMVVWCCAAHFTSAKWWLDNDIGKKEGKFYRGIVGPDTTELGFWSGVIAQVNLSVQSLSQLIIRRHTGGVSWSIWATRTFGSIIGLHLIYAWMYYHWPAAHMYLLNPFAVLLVGTSLTADFLYPFFFVHFRKTERVLEDGRKVAGAETVVEGEKKGL